MRRLAASAGVGVISHYAKANLGEEFLIELDHSSDSRRLLDAGGMELEKESLIPGGRLKKNLQEFATLELPPIAVEHLKRYPFKAPANAENCVVWYEGTFDPMGPHHYKIFRDTLDLGFGSAVLALCFQNPLKPKSTDFELRCEMALEVMKSDGIPIAKKYGDRGVHIFTSEPEFYFYKHRAWVDKSVYLLMGPDNFADYYQRNPCWTHDRVFREDPDSNRAAQFRTLYSKSGFQRRVLVYPELHDIHSTDIRRGTVKPLPVVAQFMNTHNLYREKVASQPSAKPQSDQVLVRRLSKPPVSFEVEIIRQDLARDLTNLISQQLGQPGRYADRVADAMADLDRSQLFDLNAALERARGIKSKKNVLNTDDTPERSEGIIRCDRAIEPVCKVRDAVMNVMVEPHLYIEGTNNVLAAYRENSQILFIANHVGAVGAGLLPYALANNDAGAIEDRLNLVVHEDIFKNPFEKLVFGHSSSVIKIPQHFSREKNGEEGSLSEALRYASGRLSKERYPVIFPEDRQHTDGLGLFSSAYSVPFEPASLFERRGDPAKVVMVPCAIQGAHELYARARDGSISEELPIIIKFGKAVTLTSFYTTLQDKRATDDPSIAGHMMGAMVADLLPSESRGVYGEAREQYLHHSDPLSTIERSDLISIDKALQVFEANRDRLYSR